MATAELIRNRAGLLTMLIALFTSLMAMPAAAEPPGPGEGRIEGTVSIGAGAFTIVDVFDEALTMRSSALLDPRRRVLVEPRSGQLPDSLSGLRCGLDA